MAMNRGGRTVPHCNANYNEKHMRHERAKRTGWTGQKGGRGTGLEVDRAS